MLRLSQTVAETANQLERDDQRAIELLRRSTSGEDLFSFLSCELEEPSLDGLFTQNEVNNQNSGSGQGNNNNRSSWLWPRSRFIHRLLCAADLLAAFIDPQQCDGDIAALSSLCPPSMDPLLDTAEDDLVGVCFLCCDPLLHLLDVDDCLKIVNFNGEANGFLKIAVRSWIDEVEPVPK